MVRLALGVTLSHSDTDVLPEGTVEFGAHIVRPEPPYEQSREAGARPRGIWVRLDFELAGLARSRPHRDDEDLRDVTGYDIIPMRGYDGTSESWAVRQAEWLRTGWCPDPRVYHSRDTAWLADERDGWAYRQRTDQAAADAVHFIVNGLDGFVEVMAAGFAWTTYQLTPGPRIGPGEVLSTGVWEQ